VRMRALVYIGASLWICLGVFILCWSLIVGSQATSNRIYKPGQSLFVRFSGNPADYNERGQQYLKRSKRLFLLWMAYLVTLFILIVNLMVFWDKLPK
jgi:sensor histidine kinase YesM